MSLFRISNIEFRKSYETMQANNKFIIEYLRLIEKYINSIC